MGWIARCREAGGGVESRRVQRGSKLHQRRRGVDKVVDGYDVGCYLLTGNVGGGGCTRWCEVEWDWGM
jgi:hypothetical protein